MADTPNPIQMQKYLSGVDYPVSKDDLVATAKEQGAPDDVIDALQALEGDSFDAPTAVSKGVADE
ncbi:hypothetical protein ABID92_002096 [Frigoribacterium sp. PvP120]|uniref:DUF2795 domain-containing protein n=1 Tax=unclassified Frigoribacterium TaxID=2627005 RepID=UPI00177C4FC4|nr:MULTISPECIES: DUF2795 domain-containing protein [unclassified Frigoribacterium]MBD8660822.1 DUF2795 domain-containing protein [Frigoribacterium sp. CFBP 8754]MBD8728192.1 DUF2795 domain-containing protein [Frigoribacterium sp. CFBP 13707]MBP1240398.1 hypothetical protein [Frigoribacterium sp. PvP121]